MIRVPIIVGRNDRNVGGRRQLVDDIDSEADAPANLPQAGSVSNFPVHSDSDSDGAGGGGVGADSESDSGYISIDIHVLIGYYISLNIHIYPCTYRLLPRVADMYRG